MQGFIHTASIYRRVGAGAGTQWEVTPFITGYKLRIDAVGPQVVLREKYASCTHNAVGEYNEDIKQGMRMVVTSGPFYNNLTLLINGVDAMLGSVQDRSHMELMLTEPKRTF